MLTVNPLRRSVHDNSFREH